MPKLVHLAVTLGDPTSIGPEVAARAISKFLKKHNHAVITAFGVCGKNNPTADRTFKNLSKHPRFKLLSPQIEVIPEKPGRESARICLEALELATESCLLGNAHALVTGPVDKNLCAKIDRRFKGHTEFLQHRCGARGSTMMLAGADLRVCLVTTHLALKDVSKNLSVSKIVDTGVRTFSHLKEVHRKPRLAVCALNPHASDGGLFGDEEKTIILPAVRKLQRLFGTKAVTGPISADTLFALAEGFEAIICMYHDQGLIPLKMRHFFDAVNVTLGLPFLRTSVDHGTAFDIAGKEKASSLSFERALDYAYLWVKSKKWK